MGSNIYTIEGQLDITRAFGFHGDSEIKKHITCYPSFKSIKIETKHICLVVATKGFWNVVGYERVADLVLQVVENLIF
jgi:serine/threonine protein phosphatase PrpC